ncbi:hypothetical protein ACE40V_24885, partial [Salmonella enterica]
FGGMGHAGGLGGGRFGGGTRFGGEHLGFGGHVGGLRQHAFHRYGGFVPGYGFYGAYPDCYDWYELHPAQPLPLSCS